MCHRKAGEERGILEVGPDLSDLAAGAGMRRPRVSAAAYIRESIARPAAFVVPGFEGRAPMPDLGLGEDGTAALLVFSCGPDELGCADPKSGGRLESARRHGRSWVLVEGIVFVVGGAVSTPPR